MPPMTPDQICSVCRQTPHSATCPGRENQSEESTQIASDQTEDDISDTPAPEVYYFTDKTAGESSRAKKIVARLLWSWYFIGVPIMCAWLAIANHDRVVFIVGTVFGLQLLYIFVRNRRYSGSVIDDPITRSRISPPLQELCQAAGVAVPRVRVRRTSIMAAVVLENKLPTLWLSPDFLQVADDAELRAI